MDFPFQGRMAPERKRLPPQVSISWAGSRGHALSYIVGHLGKGEGEREKEGGMERGGREGERERGREGEKERGRKGGRERGREGEQVG